MHRSSIVMDNVEPSEVIHGEIDSTTDIRLLPHTARYRDDLCPFCFKGRCRPRAQLRTPRLP